MLICFINNSQVWQLPVWYRLYLNYLFFLIFPHKTYPKIYLFGAREKVLEYKFTFVVNTSKNGTCVSVCVPACVRVCCLPFSAKQDESSVSKNLSYSYDAYTHSNNFKGWYIIILSLYYSVSSFIDKKKTLSSLCEFAMAEFKYSETNVLKFYERLMETLWNSNSLSNSFIYLSFANSRMLTS